MVSTNMREFLALKYVLEKTKTNKQKYELIGSDDCLKHFRRYSRIDIQEGKFSVSRV